jgi:predicted Zn-dependent protease
MLTEQAYFEDLCTAVLGPADAQAGTGGLPRISLALSAESSDFLRFNQSRLRQATQVEQAHVAVTVTQGQRAAQATHTLSGDLARDTAMLQAAVRTLHEVVPLLPEDPHLLQPDAVTRSTRNDTGSLPSAAQVIDAVRAHADGVDLVGLYAGGPVVRALADNRGQRHWHRVETFSFDWCLYHAADKAVKTACAGTAWDEAAFARLVAEAAEQVALLARPAISLAPGRYRAWFAPAAMAELLSTLGWGGFSLKEQRTGTSPLMRLLRGHDTLHASVHLSEDNAQGGAPAFSAEGFARPACVPLVSAGSHVGSLVSPRSAREFDVAPNGADAAESPQALRLAAGTLPEAEVLAALDTGLYISNLHYLNFSDRLAGRVTGMTRFACFWVEGGRIVAPLNVMRFDDDLLRLLGPGLVALGSEAVFQPHTDTYGSRQLGSVTTPGALVADFALTL